MTVDPLTRVVYEDRALEPFTDCEVEGPSDPRRQWHGDDLAAFAGHSQGAVTSLQSQRVDVGAERLGDAQPIQCQQRHQGVISWRGQPRGDEQRSELVAIQAGRV